MCARIFSDADSDFHVGFDVKFSVVNTFELFLDQAGTCEVGRFNKVW